MPIDDFEHRPITFQGQTFPATLMGIDILVPILDTPDEDLKDWLWKLAICRGVTKRAQADECARCARKTLDLMLEQRQLVLDGIRDRLVPHGFDPETTYSEWVAALQRIAELSDATDGVCTWSAPSHQRDKIKSKADVDRVLRALDRWRPDNP